MPTYTLSSTDPDRYSRIRVTLPIEMSSERINICVSSLTANANFELLCDDDYIEFSINNEIRTLKFKSTSKLTSASLSYVFQDLLNEQKIPIAVEVSDTDCLSFTASEPFLINRMSYNAKLVTGFYYVKTEDYPLIAKSFETQTDINSDRKNVDITQATVPDMNIRVGYTKQLKISVAPDTAYGYTSEFEIANDKLATINFFNPSSCEIEGLAVGNTTITVKIKNPNTSKVSEPDFTITARINVMGCEKREIESITLPQQLNLKINETETLYPEVTPATAGYYIEQWYSEDNSIAIVSSGVVTAISEGQTVIHCTIVNRSDTINQQFDIIVNMSVLSDKEGVTKYRVQSKSVGYLLSTPILYVIGVVGAPLFSNQMDNSQRMNSGCTLMILNNSFSASFPIAVQQSDVVVQAFLNYASDFTVYLVDANFREVKLLNPFYITVQVEPVVDEGMTQGLMIG